MNKYFLLAFLFVGFLWSCSDSELITPGDEFLNVTNPGTYSVDIDGVHTDFSYTTQATSSSDGSSINGTSIAGEDISIQLPGNLSTGVFAEANGARITINLGADGIFTNLDAAGELLPLSVSVMEVNNNIGYVTGTFTGTVFNAATGVTKSLTNGQFYQIEFEPTASIDRVLKAEFNGTMLNFSTDANATGIATAAVISGFNSDNIQNLSITIPGGISEATYSEENNVVISVQLGTSNNPSDIYTNYNAATGEYLPFTLTITEITGDVDGRVKGTFSGSITKFINGVPTGGMIEITNGEINVPIELP